MTIMERGRVETALRRAMELWPDDDSAVASVAQALGLLRQVVADCMPLCACCNVKLGASEVQRYGSICSGCEAASAADEIVVGEELRHG